MNPHCDHSEEGENLLATLANDDADADIIYAFVVFSSMEAVRLLEATHNVTYWERFWTKTCLCCFFRKRAKINEQLFEGKYLEIESAMMPDNIIWHNMGVTWWEKFWRSCLLIIVGLAVLLFSIVLSIQIQGYLNYLQQRYVATDECPAKISKL